jgi:hypothetical protein
MTSAWGKSSGLGKRVLITRFHAPNGNIEPAALGKTGAKKPPTFNVRFSVLVPPETNQLQETPLDSLLLATEHKHEKQSARTWGGQRVRGVQERLFLGSEREFVKTLEKMRFSTIEVFRLNSAGCETTISQKS